ncbi:hypothetical protein CPB97_002960 [Podila verticillata]|nr:hypothetical protein CPB97_002960 [Podila verticillata]
MPSSTTHNFVRVFQLCLSTSLVATAAFLLHYRTRAHSNFTNEPLASCISGSVAFIYALWALLNHRRQPDKHQWIYLHGLGCFVVCGLLIAGATLAIIFGQEGVLCEKLQEAHDYDAPGSSSVLQQLGANITRSASHPEFHNNQAYAPGQICENYYAEMDNACAVLGIVAALFWVADFCLIFGFCGSKGRYGPHREYRRRGQVSPEDDDMESDHRDSAYGGSRDREFDAQENYYDTLDGRKRNLEWIENRNRDDPMRLVQGPIPMSLKTNFYSGNESNDIKGVDQNNNKVTVTVTAGTPGIDLASPRLDIQTPPSISLNPPPRAQWRPQSSPDSPTLPENTSSTTTSLHSTLQLNLPHALDGAKPVPVRLPSDIADALSPKPLRPQLLNTQHSECPTLSLEPEYSECPTLSLETEVRPYLTLQLPVAEMVTPSELTSEDVTPSTSSSPRYTEFPPGPACYVFDSCNHEYLPSFVNQAARNEMRQQIKISSSSSAPKEKSLPPTPQGATPSVSTRRVLITELGLEVITISNAEIAAEEKEAIELAKQQQQQKSMMASSVAGGAQPVSLPGKVERPRKIIIPSNNLQHRPNGDSSSYFPTAPTSPASPTTSIRSFLSAKSQDPTATTTSSSPNGSQTSMVNQPHMTKKPSLTKRKSKLSVVTQNKAPGSGSGGGVQEAEPNRRTMSPLSSSPSSPYIGDF